MLFTNLPLVSWTNGTIMIGVFVVVVVGLIATLLLLINSGSKTKEKE
jgi:hypothetical protein